MHSDENETSESGIPENPPEETTIPMADADASHRDDDVETNNPEEGTADATPHLVILDLETAEDAGDGGEEGEEGDADEDGGEAPEELTLPFDSVVEAILFASREPLKTAQIARAVARGVRQSAVRAAMDRLNLHYLETGRAFEIAEISGRFQLMSRPEYVLHLRRLYPKRQTGEKEKNTRLTPAALDTLSIIAYKQPVTRGEMERIRGVGCGAVLRALIERGTVRVAGKRADLLGQPLTYGTTEAFLVEFGLGSLDELPLRNEFLSAFPTLNASHEPGAQTETSPETASGDNVDTNDDAEAAETPISAGEVYLTSETEGEAE